MAKERLRGRHMVAMCCCPRERISTDSAAMHMEERNRITRQQQKNNAVTMADVSEGSLQSAAEHFQQNEDKAQRSRILEQRDRHLEGTETASEGAGAQKQQCTEVVEIHSCVRVSETVRKTTEHDGRK